MLDWDTDFFGVKVARINELSLNQNHLSEFFSELKTKGVNLIYWPSSQEIEEVIVKRYNGILADKKTTFAVDLGSLNFEKFISTDIVEPFTQSMSVSDLQDLAIQSGEYSRFSVDEKIPREKWLFAFKGVEKIWPAGKGVGELGKCKFQHKQKLSPQREQSYLFQP